MKDTISKKMTDFLVQPERSHFHYMLAKNPNYFGNIIGSTYKENYKLIADKTYEQITCLGYNPETSEMEATFSISKSSGYSGNLCSNGSLEYVRFYIDFHDGAGFIDQGSVGINVHDIPAGTDCNGNSIFPINYVATIKRKTSKYSNCESPLLPTLRAILSWSTDPPVDSPDWNPVWGSVMDCNIQMKPSWKFIFPEGIDLSEYFTLAISNPYLTTKQLTSITGVDLNQIKTQQAKLSVSDLAKKYEKTKVSASRFAFKTIQKMFKYPTSEITLMNKSLMGNLNINLNSIIDELTVFPLIDNSKANVDYEELKCVGLDYNSESLVASVSIKKNSGYSGDLCDEGSKEYVSFWVDWDNNCQWQYLNTMELKVHDIHMIGDELCYSVSLPIDTTFHKKLCATANVVRVRSVLSWNTPPSTTDPNKLEFYGNRVDTHIQIKPGTELTLGDVKPIFDVIGGIGVDFIDNSSGLTNSDTSFIFNGNPVKKDSSFGGKIVINGPSFIGYRYKIKVTNLSDNSFYYENKKFQVTGFSLSYPHNPEFDQQADADGYYWFRPFEENRFGVLARITPETEDKFRFEIEIDTVPGTFYKAIQIDNSAPVLDLNIYDNGDCTKFKKGDIIQGSFSVYDAHIDSWSLTNSFGLAVNKNSPSPGEFEIQTQNDSYPCGYIMLSAVDKTIIDSQSYGFNANKIYSICLQNP
jgi:hypothetical protein